MKRAIAIGGLLLVAAYFVGRASTEPHAGHEGVARAAEREPTAEDPHAGHQAAAAPAAPGAPSTRAPARPPAASGAPEGRDAPVAASRVREEPRVAIEVPFEQQRRIGLSTVKATRRALQTTIRSVGIVTSDERREEHVHTKVPGWIEDVPVNTVGAPVKKGSTLFYMYSPDIYSTQLEYVASVKAGGAMADAALERLTLLEVPASQIERLKQTLEPRRALPFDAPISGTVVATTVKKGLYVTPEIELYMIADLTNVWVIATLYEAELSQVKVGDAVRITLPYAPEASIAGTISFIYPDLEVATRTGKARIEVKNHDLALKPGMYATAEIEKVFGDAIVVPADAVLSTGVRDLVFVKTAEGRFTPREVQVGARLPDGVAVTAGIDEGDDVVVKAAFLIDAESRLQAALKQGGGPSGHSGHGG